MRLVSAGFSWTTVEPFGSRIGASAAVGFVCDALGAAGIDR
jgi:hypothetical protein